MSKIELRLLRDTQGIISRKRDDVITYSPWDFKWQGMSETERTRRGIYVTCFGQGEFEILYGGHDVLEV